MVQPWGVLLGILGGGARCHPVLQILTLFLTKKLSFSTPVFRPAGGHKTQHYMFI